MSLIITPEQYFMGRDVTHSAELTFAIRANAEETVRRWNALLAHADNDGVCLILIDGSPVASGWRPRDINERTANAGAASTHLSAEALDGHDAKPGRPFARWCLQHTAPWCTQLGNPDLLAEVGLWMEDPRWTWREDRTDEKKSGLPWVHLQTRPPHSGLRVYRPSMSDALAAALPEQMQA